MEQSPEPSLFVWRNQIEAASIARDAYQPYPCPWCGCKVMLKESEWEDDEAKWWRWTCLCMLCGYSFEQLDFGDISSTLTYKTLKSFGVSSPEVTLQELSSHLKRQYSDIYALSWEKFEDLVEHVFRQSGFRTVQTVRRKDKGADILFLGKGDRVEAIVECKKYARTRTVGVALVRQLLGAAVMWDVRKAILVTTAGFTSCAVQDATDAEARGYECELVRATELLQLLDVRGSGAPPLNDLSENDKQDIIAANSNYWMDEKRSLMRY